ncbi:hypothetical protein EDC01DRAFT_627695 [Geopyxis carbonaria]|nr:hypothetical protein EDC01DRAFT_627695 [Geopyxis carbonaria]
MAYGETYQTGWLIIWQLKIMIEMKRGDVCFFYGSFLAHNVVDIVGQRNSLDCFTHKSVLDWWKRITNSKTNLNHGNKRKRNEDYANGPENEVSITYEPTDLTRKRASRIEPHFLQQVVQKKRRLEKVAFTKKAAQKQKAAKERLENECQES